MGTAIPLVRASAPLLVARFLRRIGAPVDRLLERSGISPALEGDPEAFVPFAAACRFIEEAARAEGIEDLGLRAGRESTLEDVVTFGDRIRQSLTVCEALRTANDLWPIYNSAVRAQLMLRGDHAEQHHGYSHGTPDSWRHFCHTMVMLYLNFLRSVCGPECRPTELRLPTRTPPDIGAIASLAGTKVTLGGPATVIRFPTVMLHCPIPRVPSWAPARRGTDWERSGPAEDVGGAVRQVVGALLTGGYPDIRLVAEAVGTSPRTLQRRLQEEHLTYGRVVAQARFEVAQRLLDDPARKLIDVALDLGYSDAANFSRAFRSWAGVAPMTFRRLRATAPPSGS